MEIELPPFLAFSWLQASYEQLCQAKEQDRLSHAYLLRGASGLGLAYLARQFAMWLQCEMPQGHSPCGACEACHQVSIETHPKVINIQAPTGHPIKIDQIREMLEQGTLKNTERHRQIYIILEADAMTEAAMNALLKFLEAPARYSVILLTTAHQHALLPTIVSRCQSLQVSKPSYAGFQAFLESAGKSHTNHEMQYLFRQTQACPLLALALSPSLHLEKSKQFLGQWLRVLLGRLPPLLLESSSDLTMIDKLNLMQTSVLDLIKVMMGLSRDKLFHQDIADTLIKLAPQLVLSRLFDLLELINEAKGLWTKQHNINEALCLEVLLIQASADYAKQTT